jgi:16S rRNA (cytosine967-C5)-methyltransferase
MRRNPDIKWRTSKKNLRKFKNKQLAFLKKLSMLVKPSGYLVYAVCSPEPEENETVINEFLKKNTEFVINKQIEGLSDKMVSVMAPNGFVKTFPHLNQMDGFAFVRLQRIS